MLLAALGRYAEARALFESIPAGDAEEHRALSGRGLAALGEGREDEAFDRFREALERDFDNAPVVGHLLDLARRRGRLAEAEPHLRRYVEFYPGHTELNGRYVELLESLGRDEEARERLETMRLLAPDHPVVQALWERRSRA